MGGGGPAKAVDPTWHEAVFQVALPLMRVKLDLRVVAVGIGVFAKRCGGEMPQIDSCWLTLFCWKSCRGGNGGEETMGGKV